MANEVTLIEPAANAPVFVVAWFAHGGHWVEVARCPNSSDARAIRDMFKAGLSDRAKAFGEEYEYFSHEDFDRVVSRK